MLLLSYQSVRLLHISCVLISGCLFALRGVATLRGAHWAMARGVRYTSYGIDTVLLLAGVSLAVRSHQYPFAAPWLTAKLVLLGVYILLGSLALKRARTVPLRIVCLVAAIAVLLLIVSIAITRNPLGCFGYVRGHDSDVCGSSGTHALVFAAGA